jgi:prepilin-type N-terminal cleavage/methylation domain-containing protein
VQGLDFQQPGIDMACKHSRLRRAVTLVEIMIVITLIGIGSAIAFWKIDIAHYQVMGDMQGIGSVFITAQHEAVAHQSNVIVTFDSTAHVIHVITDANNNGTQDPGEHETAYALGDRVRFGVGAAPSGDIGPGPITFVQTVNGLPSVTFFRNGAASQAGGIYITSVREAETNDPQFASETHMIEVARATGHADWWHYNGAQWVRGF